MMDRRPIGQWIRQRREVRVLTRAQLAARAACTPDTIKKIEEGKRRPSQQLAELLAAALEFPPPARPAFVEWVLGRAAIPPDVSAPGTFPDLAVARHPPPPLLPRPLTALIGREQECAAVAALLMQEETRLVTVTGEGGVGKTRLALAVAGDLQDRFPDGVSYVSLAALRDPELVLATVAATRGVEETADQTLPARLAAHLATQDLLLVLDNFEQVGAAAPLISEWLRAAPRLKVLVTSRATLRVEGEHVYRLPPLPAEAAQALFAARARAVQPELALTAPNQAAIAAICARVDGLPLALELAAAHSRLLAPAMLLAQLEPRLPLLAGGRRDSPPHQRTLRTTLDWSYALLPPAAQLLFRRLAVFPSGGRLAAVVAVTGTAPAQTLLDAEVLLNHSLLSTADGTDEPHFTMLETIREYAGEQLTASGEEARVQHAHAEYFAALAEAAEPHRRGTAQQAWLTHLEDEHANLRAALGWALERVPALAGRLAGALWPFWAARGHWSEGRRALEAVLAATEGPPLERAALLQGAGTLARLQGDRRPALGWLQGSLTLYREHGESRGAAACLYGLADLARADADRERSAQLGAESLTLYRAASDPPGIVDALLLCADEGEDDQARASRYQEALDLARASQYLSGIALATHRLAGVAEGQDDLPRAIRLYEESLTLFRTLGDQRRIATVVEVLGEIAASTGEPARARACFEESHRLYHQLGARDGLLSVAYNLAKLEQATEQWAPMAVYAAQGLAEARAIRNVPGIRDGLLLLGQAQFHLGEYTAALAAYGEALEYVTERTRPRVLVPLLLGLAAVAAHAGEFHAAAACLGAADAQGPRPASAAADYDQITIAVRAGLDAATCAAAWSRGHAWTTADITTFPWQDLARPAVSRTSP